ncbi:MAG: HlyD family type I secretion periplasmic adaptor subunit [Pseudomonadota bacterium]
MLYFIAISFIVLFVWSAIAQIDEVTRGQAKVIPSRQIQVIQSQDGGIVSEILVTEGDIVDQGQLLMRLDQTRSQSTFRENLSEWQALSVKSERLRALAEGTDFVADPALMEAIPNVVAQEMALFESAREEADVERQIFEQQLVQRQEEFKEISARERQLAISLDLAQQEAVITRPMVSSGAVSQVEILRLEREVNQLDGELAQARAQISRIRSSIQEAERKVEEVEFEFENAIREELAATLTRMNSLREAGAGLSHRVSQNEIASPVNGTINRVHFHTIGGVVLPGKEILEIVPADDTLLLEVQINPKDIAFLVPGQSAFVKFTAYDFVVFGGLDGRVERIGADTIMDHEGNPYYAVRVRTQESGIGEGMPILPGMIADVDILTGQKSILAYLMKPVLRAKQVALTER